MGTDDEGRSRRGRGWSRDEFRQCFRAFCNGGGFPVRISALISRILQWGARPAAILRNSLPPPRRVATGLAATLWDRCVASLRGRVSISGFYDVKERTGRLVESSLPHRLREASERGRTRIHNALLTAAVLASLQDAVLLVIGSGARPAARFPCPLRLLGGIRSHARSTPRLVIHSGSRSAGDRSMDFQLPNLGVCSKSKIIRGGSGRSGCEADFRFLLHG